MPNILDFLACRQIDFRKSCHYVEGRKAVLDVLEYEAAKPTNNQACEFTGEPRATFLVDFSPNMLRAASTHGDHSLRVTDIQTGKCTHILNGHPRTPWCLAFNPTSNDILASGCLGGEVRIWDLLGGGSEVLHNPSYGAVITSLAFHPSGQVLVFATINCIYFWDWNKPTPFAVTKTNHEYERIRWLRFDPRGKYLYTGIANNTTLHREAVRNVVNIRDSRANPRREVTPEDARDARTVLFRNRMRYNQLMQRFRTFQENQNQRPEYPENVRPRSPVHEENLNLARQYANHVTESMSGSVFIATDQGSGSRRPQDSHSRPGIIREDFLLQSSSSSSLRASERERPSNGRGWGRYQPSFFTAAGAASDSNNNNSNGGTSGFDGNNNEYTARTSRFRGGHGESRSRTSATDGSIRIPILPRPRLAPSINYSSSFYEPSYPPWPQGLEPYARLEDLEADEFEILPVDQSDADAGASGGGRTSDRMTLTDRLSISETAHNLELQLRELRHELYSLTQNNIDINRAILTLPNHRSAQRVGPPVGLGEMQSFSFNRPSVRSAGSALSRSMFSRSGTNSSAAASSSSSLLTSSSPVTSRANILSNLVSFSRSVQSTSSVPSTSFTTSSETTRSSGSNTTSTSSVRLNTLNPRLPEHWGGSSSHNERDNLSIVPTTLTDSTSQTFGAMNLPERLDQSTDISGLSNSLCRRSNLVKSSATRTKEQEGSESKNIGEDTASTSTLLSLQQCVCNSNASPCVYSSADIQQASTISVEGPESLSCTSSADISQAPTSGNSSSGTSLSMRSGQCSSSSSSSSSILSSAGILRTALTAVSSSSSLSSSLASSSTLSQSTGRSAFFALNTSASGRNEESISGLRRSNILSGSARVSTTQVFRSIASLRNRLSDIMAENRVGTQLGSGHQISQYNSVNRPTLSNSLRPESRHLNFSSGTSNDHVPVVRDDMNSESSGITPSVERNENSSASASSDTHGVNQALRSSIANVQRRLSDVLSNMRTSQGQRAGDTDGDDDPNLPGRFQHSVQRLRDMEYRILSQTTQVLSQTTAYWTEFLERSVLEMNRRISDLERRLETNRYLLSSHPFSHRPVRPHDALISRLVMERTYPGNNRRHAEDGYGAPTNNGLPSSVSSGAPTNYGLPSSVSSGASTNNGLPSSVSSGASTNNGLPSSVSSGASTNNGLPSSVSSGASGESNMDARPARGPRHRNQLLLDFLVWRGSRDSQSQRSLSFGQPAPNQAQSSSSSSSLLSSTLTSVNPEPTSLPPPSLSTSSTSVTASSSSSVPLSITIHPSREERNDLEEGEEDTGRRREERGQARDGRNDNDGSWRGLQHIHLHPDYSSSILDDTLNRPNEAMQHMMNRTIAGVLDREEQAVASNIIPQTHRIQRWDVSEVIVPDISLATANIVVEQCKLHNDASCDISQDGTLLATFVPSHRGFPDDNILGVFSLKNESFGQCLYTKSFGPNAISASISPGNHYVMVGLAARRYFLFSLSNKMVGQVYKMVKEKAGEKSMKHITDLYHPRVRGVQLHISVNFGRWLPSIGEGIVYGTNRGDLHFCRPGPRRVSESEACESRSDQPPNSRHSAFRNNISTQTTTVSIRRSASTQTQGEETVHDESSSSSSE